LEDEIFLWDTTTASRAFISSSLLPTSSGSQKKLKKKRAESLFLFLHWLFLSLLRSGVVEEDFFLPADRAAKSVWKEKMGPKNIELSSIKSSIKDTN
jgi:hypothetical protein